MFGINKSYKFEYSKTYTKLLKKKKQSESLGDRIFKFLLPTKVILRDVRRVRFFRQFMYLYLYL